MKAQFKYALRQGLSLRAASLALVIIMNVVFGFLGYFNLWGEAGKITAVTLSSVSLFGLFCICAMADTESLKSVFDTPKAYLNALTPVKAWKILLARVVSIVCEDFITLFIGIFGIVWQSLVLSGLLGAGVDYSGYLDRGNGYGFLGMIILFLGYAYLTMLIVFGLSLKNSVLFGVPARSWLAVPGVLVVAWVFNLTNFALAPFGTVEHWRIFYHINIPVGFYTGFALYAIMALVRIVVLFIASSLLIERKNNL